MVRDKPASIQLLGAGKRASTLRARTRAIRKCAVWLASAFSVSFPRETSHVLEYLQVRLNEPACRGAIEGAHQAMCFSEEVCGVADSDRCTNSRVYLLAKDTCLSNGWEHYRSRHHASQQHSSRQSRNWFRTKGPWSFFRIFGWWVLVQSCGTWGFSDLHGIVPSQVEIDAIGFTARLTHSKTLGSDRNVTMRDRQKLFRAT